MSRRAAPKGELRSAEDARASLETLAAGYAGRRLCFVGHMHEPAVYAMRGGEAEQRHDSELCLDEGVAYLINPGSVGQSRNIDPRASLLVYDSTRRTVQFCRIDYDYATAKAKALAQGLIPRPHAVLRTLSWLKRHLLPPQPIPVDHAPR